jgi:L-iditol 2-dehydrogenase
MKALVLESYGRLVCREAPEPRVGPEEVLIRVRACGICGSDVHGLDGSTGRRVPPLIMGHEAAGVVERTGERVEDLRPGERVTFDSTVYCGECAFCRQGRINLCDRRQVFGVSCEEYRRDGAFAEYVAVPRRCVYMLPEGLGFEQAATVEPLSVALHAVGRAPVAGGDTAVVFGAGMIGLLVVQALRAAGCARVYAVDLDRSRLELALGFGAEEGLDPAGLDIPKEILRRTGGRGADLVFDAVGLPVTLRDAVAMLRKGGSLVLVGNLAQSVDLALQKAVARELTLYGSCASSGEYPRCLDLLARGVIWVDPLLSASAPLSEGAAWFERLHRGEKGLIKVCLLP